MGIAKSELTQTPKMLSKIKTLAKQPSTYVILGIGIVLAFAYGRFFGAAKTLASKLPGAKAA